MDTEQTETKQSPAEWDKDPARYLHEVGVAATGLDSSTDMTTARYDAVDFILGAFLNDPNAPDMALSVIAILRVCSSYMGHMIRSSNEWIRYGPIIAPSTPNGIGTIRKLRDMACMFSHSAPRELFDSADTDHLLARLLDAYESGAKDSAVLGTVRNVSESKAYADGIQLGVDLDSNIMRSLPRGETVPRPILCTLEGREIKGSDVQEITCDSGMCEEGVADFLNRFSISHDQEGGDYECDSCGLVQETEEGGITDVGDFTLTADMIEALDDAGYLDSVQDALGAGEDLSTLLDECDDAKLAERLAPAPMGTKTTGTGIVAATESVETGIAYNRDDWTFEPDYETVDGLDGLEFTELARILPALAVSVAQHEARGILPPIGGKLVHDGRRDYGRRGDRNFRWNPYNGTLTHNPAHSDIVLVHNVKSGLVGLTVVDLGLTCVNDPTKNGGQVHVPVSNAGALAREWFPLAQSQPTI